MFLIGKRGRLIIYVATETLDENGSTVLSMWPLTPPWVSTSSQELGEESMERGYLLQSHLSREVTHLLPLTFYWQVLVVHPYPDERRCGKRLSTTRLKLKFET